MADILAGAAATANPVAAVSAAAAPRLIDHVVDWIKTNKAKVPGYLMKPMNIYKYVGRKAENLTKRGYNAAKRKYKRFKGYDEDEVERDYKETKQRLDKESEKIGSLGGSIANDFIADKINTFYGIDPTADDPKIAREGQKVQALNAYADGTQLQQALNTIKNSKSIKDIDWSAVSGGAAELVGNATKKDEGSTWSPLVAAGIGAAKKYLNITNPLLGMAMDVGGLLATTPIAREVAGKIIDGGVDLAKRTKDRVVDITKRLFKGKDPALQHSEGVIPIHAPVEQKPIDYSGINIPNLLPQESNAAYMMRMTGGMNVGPANANVVSYSGYRKPQYTKTDNAVMLAAPRLKERRKKVRVRRRR